MKLPRFVAGMSKKQQRQLASLLLAGILYVIALLVPAKGFVRLLLFLLPYGVVGWRVLWKAVKNISHGQIFDENFLMAVASIGALCAGEYPEAVAVMLFYQVGDLFESCAVGRSRQSIAQLMDIRPDSANVERDGEILSLDPEEIAIGEVIVIRPGERVPLDGTVLEGSSNLDTMALTGESVPRSVHPGDGIVSGCINLSGALRVRVEREFGESTVAKVLELVENASSRKAKTENFITKFARIYTPAVCGAALLLAVVPSLITGNWSEWISRALIFLVVSCPCALVISVPLSFFGGIGGASRAGILIKGSNFMEALSQVNCVVFDKTGTLTRGSFELTKVHCALGTPEQLVELAALAESYSTHPIAESLRRAWGGEIEEGRVREVEEISGKGVIALVDGQRIAVGNEKLMRQLNVDFIPCIEPGTLVYVACEGKYLGCAVISDAIKPQAKEAISALHACGVRTTAMLSGDHRAAAEAVGKELGLDEVRSELLPDQKVEQLEAMLARQAKGKTLAYVGDGINDAPVLSRADVGIAMGALGSDAAIEAADVVLMDDNPLKIASAIRISQRTLRIVMENILFALSVKFVILVLSAFGLANMWLAVFGDVGVSVIAILNAMRALKLQG